MDNGQNFYYGNIDSLFNQYKSRYPNASPNEIIEGVKELVRNGYSDLGNMSPYSFKGQKGYYAASNGMPIFVPASDIKRVWTPEEIKASRDRENGTAEISEYVEQVKRNQEEANKETRVAEKKSIENYKRKKALDAEEEKRQRLAREDAMRAMGIGRDAGGSPKTPEDYEAQKRALREANAKWDAAQKAKAGKGTTDPVASKEGIREEPKKPSVKDEKNLTDSGAGTRKSRKPGKKSSAVTKGIENQSEGKGIEAPPSAPVRIDEANIIQDEKATKEMPSSSSKRERVKTAAKKSKAAVPVKSVPATPTKDIKKIDENRLLDKKIRDYFKYLKEDYLAAGQKDVRVFSSNSRYAEFSKRYSKVIKYKSVDTKRIVPESKITGTEREKYAIRKKNYRILRIDRFSRTNPVKKLEKSFYEEFKKTIKNRGVNGKLYKYIRRQIKGIKTSSGFTKEIGDRISQKIHEAIFKTVERKILSAEAGVNRTRNVIRKHSLSIYHKSQYNTGVANRRELSRAFYRVGDVYDSSSKKTLKKYYRLATVYNSATGRNDKSIVKYGYYGKKAKAREASRERKNIRNMFKSIDSAERIKNRNFSHQNFLSRKEKWRKLLVQYWRSGEITPAMEKAAKRQYETEKMLRAKERSAASAENRRQRDIARSRNPNERTLTRRKAYNMERAKDRAIERALKIKKYSRIRENAIARIRKSTTFGKKPIVHVGAYRFNRKFLTYGHIGGKADFFTPEECNPARNNFARRSTARMERLGPRALYSASFLESNVSPSTFNAPTSMFSVAPAKGYDGGIMFVVDEAQLVNGLYKRIPQAITEELKKINPKISKKLLDLIEPYVPKDTGRLYQSARETSSLLASKGVKFGRTAPGSAFAVSISYNTPYAEIVYYDPSKAHGAEYNAKHGGNLRGEKECYRWIEKALNENGAAVDTIRSYYAIAFNNALNKASGGRKSSNFI